MFWEKYKLPIMAAVALLVLGLVGSEFYQSNLARRASEASALLNAAKTDAEYQKVIDAYPGSEAAANAYLLLGRSKYNAKDYAGATQAWQALAEKFPKHPLVPGALTGVAEAQEAQGKLNEARATYQRIATGYANSYAGPLARLGEADVLLAQRENGRGKAHLRRPDRLGAKRYRGSDCRAVTQIAECTASGRECCRPRTRCHTGRFSGGDRRLCPC